MILRLMLWMSIIFLKVSRKDRESASRYCQLRRIIAFVCLTSIHCPQSYCCKLHTNQQSPEHQLRVINRLNNACVKIICACILYCYYIYNMYEMQYCTKNIHKHMCYALKILCMFQLTALLECIDLFVLDVVNIF